MSSGTSEHALRRWRVSQSESSQLGSARLHEVCIGFQDYEMYLAAEIEENHRMPGSLGKSRVLRTLLSRTEQFELNRDYFVFRKRDVNHHNAYDTLKIALRRPRLYFMSPKWAKKYARLLKEEWATKESGSRRASLRSTSVLKEENLTASQEPVLQVSTVPYITKRTETPPKRPSGPDSPAVMITSTSAVRSITRKTRPRRELESLRRSAMKIHTRPLEAIRPLQSLQRAVKLEIPILQLMPSVNITPTSIQPSQEHVRSWEMLLAQQERELRPQYAKVQSLLREQSKKIGECETALRTAKATEEETQNQLRASETARLEEERKKMDIQRKFKKSQSSLAYFRNKRLPQVLSKLNDAKVAPARQKKQGTPYFLTHLAYAFEVLMKSRASLRKTCAAVKISAKYHLGAKRAEKVKVPSHSTIWRHIRPMNQLWHEHIQKEFVEKAVSINASYDLMSFKGHQMYGYLLLLAIPASPAELEEMKTRIAGMRKRQHDYTSKGILFKPHLQRKIKSDILHLRQELLVGVKRVCYMQGFKVLNVFDAEAMKLVVQLHTKAKMIVMDKCARDRMVMSAMTTWDVVVKCALHNANTLDETGMYVISGGVVADEMVVINYLNKFAAKLRVCRRRTHAEVFELTTAEQTEFYDLSDAELENTIGIWVERVRRGLQGRDNGTHAKVGLGFFHFRGFPGSDFQLHQQRVAGSSRASCVCIGWNTRTISRLVGI